MTTDPQNGNGKHPQNLPSQLAMQVAREKGKARQLLCQQFDVPAALVNHATKVLQRGVPELAAAIDEGRLSVTSAVKLLAASPEVQKDVATKARFAGGRYRMPRLKVPEPIPGVDTGKALVRGEEAINCLKRIARNDPLKKRVGQLVASWIKHHL
jgi:hypothetical protein